MSDAINVKIAGDKELLRKLEKLDDDLEVWSSTMFTVGSTMKKFYSTMPFATQGGVYGARWPRLKSSYATKKAKKYRGKPILIATGTMSKSFEFAVSAKSVTITNRDEKFAWHNLGTSRLPQRIMLMLDEKRRRAIAKVAGEELARKVASL